MSFNIGLSGLYAANKQLDVTGNNIANVATTGFKSSRAEFADIYAASRLGTGNKTIGTGVNLAAVSQQFTQGEVTSSGGLLDMAIQGGGFFVQKGSDGSLEYTRSGSFKPDKDGYITNNTGTSRLQGYAADEDGKISKSGLTDLRINLSNLPPKASTKVDSSSNLNSSKLPIDQVTKPFNPGDTSTFTEQYGTTLYDTQGNAHEMVQYMVKTDSNTWKSYTLVDGHNPDGSSITASPPVASTVTFDTAGALQGIITPPSNVSNTTLTIDWKPGVMENGVWNPDNGAAGGKIAINMGNITQYNSASYRNPPITDGYATGEITGLKIDGSGVLFATFSNQQSKAIGQVSLASFNNEQGLQPAGGTAWKETFASGQPGYDAPESGTLGSLVANSLENSNVNLTNELVDLIKAQSNYQANAKTISTQSTIMQTIIQMT
ncbi:MULTISPECIES: flagellar hook protein FlgE [Pseudomonas]|uniref:Flagellar hook protein FlgE n=1 Tax=Pseudomonas gessardii TaxID=78544 RepID=A0A7Y1MM27_9PSED|nr:MULTISPECIES: flagellar hook protein FlgE [Pseudomonas]MBH3424273.1 flagellar hook protein FlgE [Pseudomonas gessardii]MCF4982370.1 flagellar hook-basal body complex protein [Pseudomonas gessardii]MCF4993114.1 flagellar hook-basal body complex protein [Pseudomonas gessardii]MCF5088104.1 flagellar hook-basal body complex protein [Pseudomonas gessardii]MCF5098695.1 flagellar hook-basal body complex protein [Pseudomonas gessardii]